MLCDKEELCPIGTGRKFSLSGTHKILVCVALDNVLDCMKYGAIASGDN